MTDRAVSVTVNYVLGLAIATLLIGGLLIATGDVVGDRRESAIRGELEVVGQRVSSGLETADRLNRAGGETVELRVSAPRRVAGEGYTIEVDPSRRLVVLETDDPAVSVEVPFRNETDVAGSTVEGGPVVVVGAGGELEVRTA